jgi:ABC-type nitrate/sulfonate/bicarbonate transport system permease component
MKKFLVLMILLIGSISMFASSKDSLNVAQTTKLEQVSNALGQTTDETFDQLVEQNKKSEQNSMLGLIIGFLISIAIGLTGIVINQYYNGDSNFATALTIFGFLMGIILFAAILICLPDYIYTVNHPDVEVIKRMVLGRG